MRISLLTLALGLSITPTVTPAQGEDAFKPAPGFTSFFNGKDFSGWEMKNGVKLDGKTETKKKRFQVVDENIVIDGKSRGNMVIDTQKTFGDVHIKFEFMAKKGCNNDMYFRGLKFDIKKGGVKNLKYGKWQQFEIIAKDNKVIFKCDGQIQRTQKARTKSSKFGLRAEAGASKYRHFQYKTLP